MAYPSLIQKIHQLDINHARLAKQFIQIANRLLRMELNYITGDTQEEKPVLFLSDDGELMFDRSVLPELFSSEAFSINDDGFLEQNTECSIGNVSINPDGYAVSKICCNDGSQGNNVEVVANLTSSSDTKALAASQGKALKEMLDSSKISVVTNRA